MSVISNTMKRRVSTRSVFPDASKGIDATISFVQGDLLFLGSNLIKPVTGGGDGATLLGIAPVTVVLGQLQKAYLSEVDASLATPAIPGPEYGSVYALTLKAGETVDFGDPVYADSSGPQVVTATPGMGDKAVGYYQGKSSFTSPTGGALIEVLVVQNYAAGV